jgi:hypothetical protein
MFIYVIDRGVSNHKEPCVACGVVGQPGRPGSWAYDEDESLLGWISRIQDIKGGNRVLGVSAIPPSASIVRTLTSLALRLSGTI